jgi:hypothetical protein
VKILNTYEHWKFFASPFGHAPEKSPTVLIHKAQFSFDQIVSNADFIVQTAVFRIFGFSQITKNRAVRAKGRRQKRQISPKSP